MNYQDDLRNLRKLDELSRQVKEKLDDGMDFWGYMGDLDVQVAYDYSPPQAQTHTDPSFDAEVKVTSVVWNATELVNGIERDTSHKRPEGQRDITSYLEDLEDQCKEDWLAKNEER